MISDLYEFGFKTDEQHT